MPHQLYLVHCGYYDTEISGGTYEFHVNYLVAARDFDDARAKAKLIPEFQKKKMHVDGLQEVRAVDGFRVELSEDASLQGETLIVTNRHRDLAPKKAEVPAS